VALRVKILGFQFFHKTTKIFKMGGPSLEKNFAFLKILGKAQ